MRIDFSAYRSYLLIFVCAFIFSPGLAARAADQPAVWKSPHFSIDPKTLYDAASQAAPADGARDTVLVDENSYSFDANCRSTYIYYMVYKVVSEKGVSGWDNLSRGWEPWHEERPVIKARVITPDFAVHELDPKTIADSPQTDNNDSVYQDKRVLRAPLPAIAPGSVVEFEITTVSSALYPGAGYTDYLFVGRVGVPVQHVQLALELPASLPLQFKLQNLSDLKPVRTEADGRVKVVFENGPLPSLDPQDYYLPRGIAENPLILFAVGTTWQRAAESFAQIVERTLASAKVDSLVEKLVHGKKTDAEKESAILAYIDKEIRYTGIEFGQNSVVPHDVGETLTRKYGDCKDKALLLIAMLRAARISAHMALLNSGRALGISQDLPGMSLFNHAIVYVSGNPGAWIDPTDNYAPIGQVPLEDQGQMALVIRTETQNLVQIPEATSTANRFIETREFYLAENGPSRVVETTRPRGGFEARYRRAYADKQDKKTQESLTSYFKSQYRSETLDRWDRTDPSDLTHPFELTLEAAKASRGYTDFDSSLAAILMGNVFNSLPDLLQRRENPEEKYSDTGKPIRKRTVDYELPEAFVKEWHYVIIPPHGFQATALPHDAKISLGPTLLTEQFSTDSSGAVHADIQFDSVKKRFSVAEATELRNKVAEIEGGEAVMISLFPRGRILQQQGKFREAFQSYHEVIAQHPQEAIHHLQLAQALLEAGSGEAARREAQLAVKMEPNSALAEKTLANILEYDLVGRKFRSGSDFAGAAEAFRAAAKLDSKDKGVIGNWAILLEHNQDGLRYGPGAKLKESVEVYRKLTKEELKQIEVRNNPSYTLFYAGEFAEARREAESLNPQPKALLVACQAALNGDQAAVQELGKNGDSEADQKETAGNAGQMLMKIRKYALAASLLQFGASGDNAARTMALAANIRNARWHEQITLGNDPKDLVMKSIEMMSTPNLTLEMMKPISSRNSRIVMDETDPEEMSKQLKVGTELRHVLARQDMTWDFVMDLTAQLFAPKGEGNDKVGYREKVDLPGGKTTTMFVVKEGGEYRILDTLDKPNAIALEILDRVAAHDLDGAKVLLDWIREDQHSSGGDDPLTGLVFPRFWTRGKNGDANQMKLAAAAMMVQTKPTALRGIKILEEARKSSSSDAERTNIDIALLQGYFLLDDFENTVTVASRLSPQFPESGTLFNRHARSLTFLKRFQDAHDLASERLKRIPDESEATRCLQWNDYAQGNFQAAYDVGRRYADAGKAVASDLNSTAWLTLFFNRAGGPDIETALKSSQMDPNDWPALHTLGCLYAEVGKTKDAHEVLVQAMDVADLDEPNSEFWYAFGRIAEQFGEVDVALEDYGKVKKPKFAVAIPGSSYQLAQNRLAALKNESAPSGHAAKGSGAQ